MYRDNLIMVILNKCIYGCVTVLESERNGCRSTDNTLQSTISNGNSFKG